MDENANRLNSKNHRSGSLNEARNPFCETNSTEEEEDIYKFEEDQSYSVTPTLPSGIPGIPYNVSRFGSSPFISCHQGLPRSVAQFDVSACGMSEAPKAKLGLNQGIDSRPVEAVLQSSHCDSNPHSCLPVSSVATDNLPSSRVQLDQEVELLEARLKRLKLQRDRDFGDTTGTQNRLEDILARLAENLTLPRLEIEPFHGSVMDYHRFITTFHAHVASQLSDQHRRLAFLLSLCRGQARQAIEHCVLLPVDEGYNEAMNILRDRFGRPDDIVRAATKKLFEGPRLAVTDTAGLTDLAGRMRQCMVTLRQLGEEEQLNCSLYLIKVVELLPGPLQEKWADTAETLVSCGRQPTFNDLLNLVTKRLAVTNSVYGQLALRSYEARKKYLPAPRSSGNNFARLSAIKAEPSGQLKCLLCSNPHDLSSCPKFRADSPTDRFKFVKELKLCYRCLGANHTARGCDLSPRCSEDGCNGNHHTLLHFRQPLVESQTRSVCAATISKGEVLLGCVPVRLVGPSCTITTTAFIDNGSDSTLLRMDVANRLGLAGSACMLNINTASGSKSVESTKVGFTILPVVGGDGIHVDLAYTVADLPVVCTGDIPGIDVNRWPHLKGVDLLRLSDPSVGILIGCDVPEAHATLEQRMGVGKQPYAVKSLFGWVLRGPCETRNPDRRYINITGVEEESLTEMLARYYEQDFRDPTNPDDKAPSLEDRKALKAVERSTVLIGNKFIVGLPWRHKPNLCGNLRAVRLRLELLKRRLSKDEELLDKYRAVIERHLERGYVSQVSKPALDDRWFIPHHPVLNPNKPGKLRVVFDCAATFHGKSLNNSLLSGPDIVNDLTGVLMRFRRYPVAVSADIEEMFLQVGMSEGDRKYFSFLWWPKGDLHAEPVVHNLNVHPFGATSSPFCATYALRKVTKDFGDKFSNDCKRVIHDNFYVDDCLLSTCTIEEASRLVKELRVMLRMGGFKLVKWSTNSPEVLNDVPVEECQTTVGDDPSKDSAQGALGLRWHLRTDTLEVKVNIHDCPMTRRGILSCVSSIYDPLGFTAPITLKARQLLQELCKCGIGWDTALPTQAAGRWHKWVDKVESIKNLRIPRCLGLDKLASTKYELHAFSDASDVGYGAVVYLRVIRPHANSVVFLLGKSRVAPKKLTTLPRLELVGAVLSAKLMRHALGEVHVAISTVVLWCDSTIVLHYLRNTSSRFATFVANRVQTIRKLTEGYQWRHVPSEMNPADVGSRGSTSADAPEMDLWLNGPPFLNAHESDWPADCFEVPNIVCDVIDSNVHSTMLSPPWQAKLLGRYSNWVKLQRAVAWLTRFQDYVYKRSHPELGTVNTGPLCVKELRKAKHAILRLVQDDGFGSPLKQRITEQCKRLNPVSIDGIWCVGGRVQGGIRHTALHPILLPPNHHVTDLIIQFCHENNGHVGAGQVLASLRQEFWIMKGVSQIKRTLRKCTKCKLLYSQPMGQIMAPLPLERTTPHGYPFRFCGIDYFGPFKVRCGRSEPKRYGCLMTCLQTRAVHIEISHSLSTDSFLMAFFRFCNRRSKPEVVYSDNGTNFVGAETELRDFVLRTSDQVVVERMMQQEIEWRFNPPGASHRGGIWERIIRSVRRLLPAVLHEQTMSDEVLMTAMTEIERILNERPLIPLYDDPSDLNVLRPVDLLRLQAVPSFAGPTISLAECYRRGWKQSQLIANTFWKRWIREYIPTLQTRSKWTETRRDVCVGDLVLIADNSVPRGSWKKGRVITIATSSDGHPRTVEVRTLNGIVRKDIRGLCLLEGIDTEIKKT